MAPTTLSSYIASAAPSSAADLAPLAANDTYAKAVNAELTLRDRAAQTAADLATRTDELHTGVAPFAAAMSGIRAVAKRFPETAKFTDEAAKQIQAAMGVVAYNPQPLPSDKPVVGAAKTLPASNVTGAPPKPPAPPAPLAASSTPAVKPLVSSTVLPRDTTYYRNDL